MASYDIFGNFYDAVMGDRADASEQLRRLIRRASPKAKNILELACGTGSVLKHLSKYYDVGDWTYQEKCSRSPGRKYQKRGCRVRIW